jgi:hypothetical protein
MNSSNLVTTNTMKKITKIPMKGDRIQWNPDLFATIEEMHASGMSWADIANKLRFKFSGRILGERFIAYKRHEEERQNAFFVKKMLGTQRTSPTGFLQRLKFYLTGQ